MTGILPFIKFSHLRILFLISTGLILVGLPYSVAFMSIGSIGIALIYLLEGDYRTKVKKLLFNKIALALLALFLWHFVSVIWSDDSKEAFKYLLKILPLFSFPIVFSGVSCLKKGDKDLLLKLFLAALVFVVIFYVFRNFIWLETPEKDPRKAVIFTSHIRLSLFIIFSAVSLQFLKLPLWAKFTVLLIFGVFIWFIQSLTALFIATALGLALAFNVYKLKFKFSRLLNKLALSMVILMAGFLVYTAIDYYSVENNAKTPKLTAAGNAYNKDLENGFIENGSYLWRFVCFKELEEHWKSNTGNSIWDKSPSGYPYCSSLVRYLNNKGLTKDFEGLEQLSDEDLTRILNGNSYPDEWKFKGFSQRFRGLLFFLEKSKNSGDFTGNSLSEKLVYQKMGFRLAKDNFILGTGAGDYKKELFQHFYNEYPEIESNKIRYPHNQFLSVIGRVGVVGLLVLIYLLYLLFTYKVDDRYFNMRRAFVIISFCSFLTEDTIDNQAGITFFALVIGLFFIHAHHQNRI